MRPNTKSPDNTGKNRDRGDIATRFQPGQSGNLKGRPKGSLSAVALLKAQLAKVPAGQQKTWGELLVQRVLQKAIIDGDVTMIRDIIDRVDGKAKISADVATTNKYEGWTKERLVDEIIRKIEGYPK